MLVTSLRAVLRLSFVLAAISSCGQSDGSSSEPSADGGGASGATSQPSAGAGAGTSGGPAGTAGTATGGGAMTAAGSSSVTGDTSSSGGASGAAAGGSAGRTMGGAGGKPSTAVGSGLALSPYLMGINYWREPDTEALWPQVKASSVKLIRYGGTQIDKYPVSNERYAEAATAIRAIGAEPYLQISRQFNAARAKQIVDYVNNVKGLKVTLWSIGNEPDGTNETKMTVNEVATMIKTLAPAMKQADPKIQIYAPEPTYNNAGYIGPLIGGALDITGKDANGRYYIDGVSFHSYQYGAGSYDRKAVTDAAAMMRGTVGVLLTTMAAADKKNNRTGAASLKWALTEFNITYANPAQNQVDGVGVHSFLNGQYFAEVFAVGMSRGALTVAPWSIHESNGARTVGDLGYLDGALPSPKPRSSYYHLQLIAQNFAGYNAPTTSTQPMLRAIASGDGTRVSVLLLNESNTNDYAFGVRLDNGKLTKPAAVTVTVDAALAAEYSATVAKESSLLLVFDATGKVTKRIEYSIADATATTAPRSVTP